MDDETREFVAPKTGRVVTMTFEEYMVLVDYMIGRTIPGMRHRDLADWDWFAAFDESQNPREAVREALTTEGYVAL